MFKSLYTLVLFILFGSLSTFAQTPSVLASGDWFKMGFSESGIYKINYDQLRELGLANADPRNLAIYGNVGGMLPQSLAVERPVDLLENAIQVFGEEDGQFNEGDYILFFVDDIHPINFNYAEQIYSAEKNLYSEENFYFLTVKNSPGKRIQSDVNLGGNHPIVNWYNQIVFHENDDTNLLNSGREWVGEQFTIQNQRSFSISIGELAPDQHIKLSVSSLAQSFSSSSMEVSLNNNLLGELNFRAIPNTQYGIKGNINTQTFSIDASNISGQELSIDMEYQQNGASNAVAYLDKFLLDVPTIIKYNQTPLSIRNAALGNNAMVTFLIEEGSNDLSVWNVSDPLGVKDQDYTLTDGNISFGAIANANSEFIAFDPNTAPSSIEFIPISNQDLSGSSTVDFIIITHEDFLPQAERLAAFRRTHDQLEVQVTTVDKIYNEYSSGRQDVTAIRDFIKSKFGNGSPLKYVLFFGKGSYDFKDRLEDNSNFVPTYESRNSIHPLLTHSSDDFFGFLEEDEGQWIESRAGDHSLDIGIGRIPATTSEQAEKAVDKIILYQSNKNTFGDWRSKIVFIADDGDNNRHQKDADSLATLIDTTFVNYNIEKIYLDAFEQIRLPNGEVSPSAQEALTNSVNNGALIVNFTGHGSESGWMQERILTFDLMQEWNNTFNLPFLVTATCEFGRNDDPGVFSGAENLIFKDVGGVIAMVTTARPVFSSTNYDLNLALYSAILNQEDGAYQRLGDIIQFTKNNSLRGSLNRNFILLGDPSMRLSYPEKGIEITSINGNIPTENDTIRALEQVSISGRIVSGSALDNGFNGTLNLAFFDKPTEKATLGTESASFVYDERDNPLFRGQARIENGTFSIDFIVPKNIDYSFGAGKINVYAVNEALDSDALGATLDFTIGGTSANILSDNTPPEIDIFINDTTQSLLPSYNTDITLIFKFFDESGINISNSGLGQNISLSLNDSISYNLNSEYQSSIEGFTKGITVFDLDDLKSGINQISITAWDIHGNSTTQSQEFSVGENTSYISVINNHPNPFINETRFEIEHLLDGENVEIGIDILNLKGAIVASLNKEFLSAPEQLNITWDGTNRNDIKVNSGLYIYRVKIYSKTSGRTSVRRQKLIISN
ncbi:type IX secretion system sortase PorU [Roseivirga sp.]|uniref:type IX secretion system sortase PorU n=1 Tax=Roseivirga sp. TaxID=1964215 RepID=UPI003B8DD89D